MGRLRHSHTRKQATFQFKIEILHLSTCKHSSRDRRQSKAGQPISHGCHQPLISARHDFGTRQLFRYNHRTQVNNYTFQVRSFFVRCAATAPTVSTFVLLIGKNGLKFQEKQQIKISRHCLAVTIQFSLRKLHLGLRLMAALEMNYVQNLDFFFENFKQTAPACGGL